MTISYTVLVHHLYILVVTLHIDIIPLIQAKKSSEDEGHFLTVQNAMEEYTTQILSLIDTICLAYLPSPFWYFSSSKINEACKRPCEIYFFPRKKLLGNDIQNSIFKQLNQKKRDKSMLFLQYLFITVKYFKKIGANHLEQFEI